MHVILGSTGVIGTELAHALSSHQVPVRLVSRQPKAIAGNEALFPADLLRPEEADRAVQGASVVYLTVGLPYQIEVWQRDWPILMKNVIDACEKHKARLVFFDNVYPLGKVSGWMTEESPIQPCSKKGEARARIDRMLIAAYEQGRIRGSIARAADFYGITPLAYTHLMVFQPFSQGKSGQWMVNANTRHCFTYVKDAARGTALLGLNPDTDNQVWHLPTDMSAPTGREFIQTAAEVFGVKPKFMTIPAWMFSVMGWFNPLMKEIGEMLYQNEVDYLFDCSKFNKRFGEQATSYRAGMEEVAREMKKAAQG